MLIGWIIRLLQKVIVYIHAYCQLYFASVFGSISGSKLTKHSPEFQSQGQLESVWTLGYNEGIIEARNFQNSSWNFQKSIDLNKMCRQGFAKSKLSL